MEQFEIYYNDLHSEAQERYLEFAGVSSAEELNHEYIPIAIIEIEKEVENERLN